MPSTFIVRQLAFVPPMPLNGTLPPASLATLPPCLTSCLVPLLFHSSSLLPFAPPNSDPVLTCDGHSYERASIEAWLARGHRTSPMTGLVLPSRKLWPNRALKHLCHALHPRSAEEEEEEKKEKARQGAAHREHEEEHDAAASGLADLAVASGTSSEDEEEDEEDEDSSSGSDSDEEADHARGMLRVMSVMPARYRPRRPARRPGVGMVQAQQVREEEREARRE